MCAFPSQFQLMSAFPSQPKDIGPFPSRRKLTWACHFSRIRYGHLHLIASHGSVSNSKAAYRAKQFQTRWVCHANSPLQWQRVFPFHLNGNPCAHSVQQQCIYPFPTKHNAYQTLLYWNSAEPKADLRKALMQVLPSHIGHFHNTLLHLPMSKGSDQLCLRAKHISSTRFSEFKKEAKWSTSVQKEVPKQPCLL